MWRDGWGEIYLEMASKSLQQPSYHARQILKLTELYTIESLDKILDYCVKNSIYGIEAIKEVLKDKYIDIVLGDQTSRADTSSSTKNSLVRDLSYY